MTGPQSYSLARLLARALPGVADTAVARLVAIVADQLRPERERAARANLAALQPAWSAPELARAARSAHAAYARFLLDYLRHAGRSRRLAGRVRFHEDARCGEALRRGRGWIVCTAHVGNWEVGAMALAERGLATMVVAGDQFAASWRSGVRDLKRRAGIEVVGPHQSSRRLLRHLQRGGVVCLLVDGDLFAGGWPAQVGGREVLLPSGPARLAAASGALLVGALCRREGDGFRIELEALGETPQPVTAGAPVGTAARRLHDAVAAWLDRTLRRHAAEWCIFRPFFPPARTAA